VRRKAPVEMLDGTSSTKRGVRGEIGGCRGACSDAYFRSGRPQSGASKRTTSNGPGSRAFPRRQMTENGNVEISGRDLLDNKSRFDWGSANVRSRRSTAGGSRRALWVNMPPFGHWCSGGRYRASTTRRSRQGQPLPGGANP
jgi:hypothetical protein